MNDSSRHPLIRQIGTKLGEPEARLSFGELARLTKLADKALLFITHYSEAPMTFPSSTHASLVQKSFRRHPGDPAGLMATRLQTALSYVRYCQSDSTREHFYTQLLGKVDGKDAEHIALFHMMTDDLLRNKRYSAPSFAQFARDLTHPLQGWRNIYHAHEGRQKNLEDYILATRPQ